MSSERHALTYFKDGVEYYISSGRMVYNPEFHENHKKPWSVQDLIFLCSSYDAMKKRDIGLALGRTEMTIFEKAKSLRKDGQFEYFKSMGQEHKKNA